MVIMSITNMDKKEKSVTSFSFLSFLLSFLLIRFSGFSLSSIVNMENYFIKSIALQTSSNTFAVLYAFLSPFYIVFLGLIFFVLGVSTLSYYGYKKINQRAVSLLGVISALFALLLFPTLIGAFIAGSVLFCCLYASKLSNTYSKELKKWVFFRTGSNTVGKVLFVVNIIIFVGIFVAVITNQQAYAASFRQDITDSMKSIALALPGASSIPSETLNQRIESAVQTSPLINSYITWLPVTTAFMAWVILEFLRNVLLSNIGGVFTYIMLRMDNG